MALIHTHYPVHITHFGPVQIISLDRVVSHFGPVHFPTLPPEDHEFEEDEA